jgi:hypothetical protein
VPLYVSERGSPRDRRAHEFGEEAADSGVNFAGFETWWQDKTGIFESDIPVLPEFMVQKIEDRVKAEHNWNLMLQKKQRRNAPGGDDSKGFVRSKNWNSLAEKLRALVKMRTQVHPFNPVHLPLSYSGNPGVNGVSDRSAPGKCSGQWGGLHNLYVSQSESTFDQDPLPRWAKLTFLSLKLTFLSLNLTFLSLKLKFLRLSEPKHPSLSVSIRAVCAWRIARGCLRVYIF